MSGAVSYHAGLAAEGQVVAEYLRLGLTLAAQRWRGISGEIDLIFRQGDGLVFVEVKKSDTFAHAADHLCQAQMRRIWNSASEFLAGEPGGQDTEVRLDVALVDAQGRIEIRESAFSF